MSLTQIFQKINPLTKDSEVEVDNETFEFDKQGNIQKSSIFKPFFLSLVIILISLLSFGLGRLSSEKVGEPVKIEYSNEISTYNPPGNSSVLQTANAVNSLSSQGKVSQSTVYASSKGKKYYYEGCSGINRISATNKISFPDAKAAEASGYTLATNCTPR